MSIVFGSLSDRLLSKGHLRVSTAAKMFECIGLGIPAISVGLMGFFTQVTNSSDSFTNLEFWIFLTNIYNDFWQTEKKIPTLDQYEVCLLFQLRKISGKNSETNWWKTSDEFVKGLWNLFGNSHHRIWHEGCYLFRPYQECALAV